jgi:hypothetical protein
VQIKELRREKPTEVSEGLYALSCGPDTRVRVCAACSINGVKYSTIDYEKSLCTLNSGVMITVTDEGQSMEFYGVLREVIQLMYNSSIQSHRIVVLLCCDWYNLDGTTKSAGTDDDRHFRSVNIKSFWYKDDPFILMTQARKIFYLQDTSLGKDWRVMQKFKHRDMYDVNEIKPIVHQDDHCSDNAHEVLLVMVIRLCTKLVMMEKALSLKPI